MSFECSVVIYLNEICVFFVLEFWCKRLLIVFMRGSFHEKHGSDSKLGTKVIYIYINIRIGIGIGIGIGSSKKP